MYFLATEVENALLACGICKEKLNEPPKALPCGAAICIKCEGTINENEKTSFNCSYCLNDHKIPENGFLVHSLIESAFNMKAIDKTETSLYNNYFSIIEKIKENFNYLKDFESVFDNNFDSLKQEIDIKAESNIDKLNKFKEELLENVNSTQLKLLNSIKKVYLNEEAQKFLKESFESFQSKIICDKNDTMTIKSVIEDLKLMDQLLSEKTFAIKSFFDANMISIKGPENEVTSNIIGSICIRSQAKNYAEMFNSIGKLKIDYSEKFQYSRCIAAINENRHVAFVVKTRILAKDLSESFGCHLKVYFEDQYKRSLPLDINPDSISMSETLIYLIKSKIVQIYDLNLNLIKQLDLEYQAIKLQVNKNHVFISTRIEKDYDYRTQTQSYNKSRNSVYHNIYHIYNQEMEKENMIAQTTNDKPFFITDQALIRNNYIFDFSNGTLSIYHLYNGRLFKNFSFPADAEIDVFGDPIMIAVIFRAKKIIQIYNMDNGKQENTFNISNISNISSIQITNNANILINDAEQEVLYLN